MSVSLIVDNDSNVADLPIGNVRDLAGMLRLLADDLDAGIHGEIISLVSLLVRADGIGIMTYGENCSSYELMGMFESAKLRVFADDAIGDD